MGGWERGREERREEGWGEGRRCRQSREKMHMAAGMRSP